MKATGGFCLYALAFPPDPTLRWYIPRARNCVPLRCPRNLSRANNACVGTAVWEGMLVRLAGRRLKVLSLSRASHRLCSWVGAFIPDAAANFFRRSVLEAAAHVERACKTGGPESFFLPQLRVIEATRKGNETGLHTCCPARLHYVTCTAALQLAFCGGVLPASAMWPRAYFSSSFAGL